jgi:hypothetical protein
MRLPFLFTLTTNFHSIQFLPLPYLTYAFLYSTLIMSCISFTADLLLLPTHHTDHCRSLLPRALLLPTCTSKFCLGSYRRVRTSKRRDLHTCEPSPLPLLRRLLLATATTPHNSARSYREHRNDDTLQPQSRSPRRPSRLLSPQFKNTVLRCTLNQTEAFGSYPM